jgi:thymidylate synthase ThyX
VIVQARTHRIGTTWDVQSQRYTGKRVVKVASKELDIEEDELELVLASKITNITNEDID